MDNVTVNEDEVINSLMNEIYGTVDGPQEEQTESVDNQQEEQIEVQPQEQQIEVQPQDAMIEPIPTQPVDANKEMFDRLMAMQQQQMQQNQMLMQELQKKEEQEPQLSEEEMAIQELKARMGLDKLEQENQMLREQLQQVIQANDQRVKQEQIQQQQLQYQEQMRVEVNNFKKEFPDVKEEVIMDYIKLQPKEVQHQFDTPHGWRMIATILKSQAAPVNKPDAITTTQSSSDTTTSASFRKKAGESVSDTDIAAELLGLTR